MNLLPDDRLFWWTRTPPPHWVAALRARYPQQENIEYPDLVWESGSPERPVQRWAIVRSFPAWAFPQVAHVLRDRPAKSIVRAGMKAYYEATGRVRWPWWLIQGDMGGHPVEYTEADAAWFRYLGQPDTPPRPGTKAYAPLDDRVFVQLQMLDLRNGKFVNPEEAEIQREKAKRTLLRQTSWDETSAMVDEDLRSIMPAVLDKARRVDRGSARDFSRVDDDELREHHINQAVA